MGLFGILDGCGGSLVEGVVFAGETEAEEVGEGFELGPEVIVDDRLPTVDEVGDDGSAAHVLQLRERES